MTEVGQAVINEYISEIEEKIEDDSLKLKISQGLNALGGTWEILKTYAANLISSFVICIIFLFLSIEESDLTKILTSDKNILSLMDEVIFFSVVISSLGTVLQVCFKLNSFFTNIKEDRVQKENFELRHMKNIIEINEELLLRHGLIKKETL